MISIAGIFSLMLGLGAAIPLAAEESPRWEAPPLLLNRSLRADQEPPLLEEVWAILDRLGKRGVRQSNLIDQLKELGPEAIPALIAALGGNRPEAAAKSDSEKPVDNNDIRRKVLTEALGCHERRSVYAHIRAKLETEGAGDAIGIFDVLAQIGNSGALPLLADLSSRIDPVFRKSPSILGGYSKALQSIVERDRRSILVLGRVWLRLTDTFRHQTIKTLSGLQDTSAIGFLVSRLGNEPRDDILIMVELSKMPAGGSVLLDERQIAALQGKLSSDDSSTRVAALTLMTAQTNSEALDEIINLINDHDVPTAKAALKAARGITGKGIGANQDQWRSWMSSEREWLTTRFPEILRTLEESEATSILPALQELQRHRASRNAIAPAVAELMNHQNPGIRAMAVSVLANLNNRLTLPTLVEALSDQDVKVQQVAWKSLRHLTGYNLPAKASKWREALRFRAPKKTARFRPVR